MSLYQNNQLWSECQMVALFNAMRFYGLNPPKMGTKEYKKICEKYCCVNGACLKMKQAFEEFKMQKINNGKWNLNWMRNHLPVQLSIFCHRGFHSVLVVKIKQNKLLLANYAYNRLHWMKWKSLEKKVFNGLFIKQIIKEK